MKTALSAYIDHTLLKQDATIAEITTLCEEAKRYAFASVCIHPFWVPYACGLLKGSSSKVCSVAGFPLGASTTRIKSLEAEELANLGVAEIDMVLNIGAFKSGMYDLVLEDIRAVVQASQDASVKVIIETCLLTEEEKMRAALLSVEGGAHFVKTSTGFSKAGATVSDVALIRKAVGPAIGVKASGGIRDRQTALAMIEAGATRIGTSSGIHIVS